MKMPAAAICEEIRKNRVISFARFMELALYCPETGYYETNQDRVGRRGDFITSVSVGGLFGQLLAFQFAEWLQEFEISNSGFQMVEAGAHDGRLAGDILAWLRANRPELFERIEYVILEPSLRRQDWQRETLKAFAPRVRWLTDFSALSSSSWSSSSSSSSSASTLQPFNALTPPRLTGLIFSNELLDAFPVHRFGWDAAKQAWFEWGVALQEENFVWSRIDDSVSSCVSASVLPPPSSIFHLPPALLAVLPDGYVVETSPAAERWWGQAAGMLAHGKLLTIDYGDAAAERFSPARLRGTLRAYSRHRVADDLLADPGGQDLTAHVNFAALQTAGESAGLRTEQFRTQPQFLTHILQSAIAEKSFQHMDARQVRQFQTLTHPEHLGRAFRVLVQGRE